MYSPLSLVISHSLAVLPEYDLLHSRYIFVEDALREPLEGRTLDVRIEEESPRFIFS
jgi:hypothetical protein